MNPTGFLYYLPNGRVALVVAYGGRGPINGDRGKAPDHERAQAFATFTSYTGSFTFDGSTVIHHIEVSAYQNEVGTDQVRHVLLDGDKLAITTAPVVREGLLQTFKLSFARLS